MTLGSFLTCSIVPSDRILPLVQHGDLVRDLLDELHVVLDHQHRAVLDDALEQFGGLLAFARRSCRRPARRASAVPGPGSAACRSPAIASGRGSIGRHRCRGGPSGRSSPRLPRRAPSTVASRWKVSEPNTVRPRGNEISRFSNTVRSSNTDGVWNLRPTPACTIWFSFSFVSSWPRNWIEPEVALVLPQIRSSTVVLPAPLGPMITRISFSST